MNTLIDREISTNLGEFIMQFAALENQLEELLWQTAMHLGKGRSVAKTYPTGFSSVVEETLKVLSEVLTEQPIYELTRFASLAMLADFFEHAAEQRNAICHGSLMKIESDCLYFERTVRSGGRKERTYSLRETKMPLGEIVELNCQTQEAQILTELTIQCLNWQVDGWSQREISRLPNLFVRSMPELDNLKMQNAGYLKNHLGKFEFVGRMAVRSSL